MAERITEETIEYVGILAKLELTEEEKKAAREDMEKMLAYIDILKELDTSQTDPASHILDADNVFREDIVTNGDEREITLANAPQRSDDCFVVPRTIG